MSNKASVFYFPCGGGPLPLMVCAGMAGYERTTVFGDQVMNRRILAFLWQGGP